MQRETVAGAKHINQLVCYVLFAVASLSSVILVPVGSLKGPSKGLRQPQPVAGGWLLYAASCVIFATANTLRKNTLILLQIE